MVRPELGLAIDRTEAQSNRSIIDLIRHISEGQG
jgi:hypothetical protein